MTPRLRSILSAWLATLLVPALAYSAAQNAFDDNDSINYRIDDQLENLRSQVRDLRTLADRTGALEGVDTTLNEVLTDVDRAARWKQLLVNGTGPRSEPQIHFSLYSLRSEIHRIERVLSPPRPSFARLPMAGTISGTVTGSDLAPPDGLANVWVEFFDTNNAWVDAVLTDGNGDFTSSSLADGTYFAKTLNFQTYVDELYDNVLCHNICDMAAEGTAIVVSGSPVVDIDFELDPGGTLSGTITDVNGGAPLDGVIVDLFDTAGEWVSNTVSEADGGYLSLGLPAGSYYARTWNELHYMNELYDDIACPLECDPMTDGGTLIPVTVGADNGGNDFDLALGGWISGNVAEQGGSALVDVVIEIFTATGSWAGWGLTDGSGDYSSYVGLPTGNYHAKTLAPAPYLDELYDDIYCGSWCDVTSGTAVGVVQGIETTAVDFGLIKGGMISGEVTDSVTSTGIVGAWVEIFDSGGLHVGSALTETAGVYTSKPLPEGTYFARTWNDLNYVDELFQEISCPFGCDETQGTPIPVIANTTVLMIDFTLDFGATMSGNVTDGATGLPDVHMQVYDSAGEYRFETLTDPSGDYTTRGIPAGTYYVKAASDAGYLNEVYDDFACPNWCDVTEGTPIVVNSGDVMLGVDFQLALGGLVSGNVTEGHSGLPIEGVTVDIFDSVGNHVSHGNADSNGDYVVFYALEPGTYHARTYNDLGYVEELYDDIVCLACDGNDGNSFEVVAGATTDDIDFDLTAGGTISGTVTEVGSGVGIAGIHVEIWTDGGLFAGWDSTAADGTYSIPSALPAGSYYYVKTWNDLGYINEVYPDTPCAACDATEGSPVRVIAGGTTTGIDFVLSPGGSISGTLTVPDPDDLPLTNIQVFDVNGNQVWSQRPENPSGEYQIDIGLPDGTYFVRTAGGRPNVNEVWDDHLCLADCDVLAAGDPVNVTAPLTTTGVSFTLASGSKLTGTAKDAATQLPIDDSIVEIFDASARRVSGCRVGSAGSFTCRQAIPDGTYYAATRNYDGYIDEIYGTPGSPCVGGAAFCDVTQGSPIIVDSGVPPGDLDFALDRGGWFEGSVIDTRLGFGLPGTGILVYDDLGDLVANVTWHQPLSQVPLGSYATCGLPSGTYYALTDTSTTGGYYTDELFDGDVCFHDCDVLAGTPITVSNGSGTSDVDFLLDIFLHADRFESGDTSGWSSTRP